MANSEASTPGRGLVVPAHAAANLRRCLLVAVPLGLAAIALLALVGYPLAGVLVCVGLALGGLNSWLVQRAVVRYAASPGGNRRRRFVGGVFGRLALVSVLALGVCVLLLPDGLGILGGLAIFQILMIAGASMPLIRELRKA
ncbi:MAG: hypothetical protein LC685_01560 [Actinobacteria bacterium]|nr:hypothetical protein [Actinomycetota bacterium]